MGDTEWVAAWHRGQVPDSACGEPDGLMSSFLVETLETRGSAGGSDPTAQPDGHPGAVRVGGRLRCGRFRGHCPLRTTQLLTAACLVYASVTGPAKLALL